MSNPTVPQVRVITRNDKTVHVFLLHPSPNTSHHRRGLFLHRSLGVLQFDKSQRFQKKTKCSTRKLLCFQPHMALKCTRGGCQYKGPTGILPRQCCWEGTLSSTQRECGGCTLHYGKRGTHIRSCVVRGIRVCYHGSIQRHTCSSPYSKAASRTRGKRSTLGSTRRLRKPSTQRLTHLRLA